MRPEIADLACLAAMLSLPVVFLLGGIPFVVLANRAIGRSFDAVHARVRESPGAIHAEDDVALRVGTFAWISASMRWLRCDVRVLDDALYVLQWRTFFGARMGQPVIRVAGARGGADRSGRSIAMQVRAVHVEPGAVIVSGSFARGIARAQLRIASRDPRALAAALASIGVAPAA